MNADERRIIDDLFDKLERAARQAGPRDSGAEALIHARMEREPAAPYLMAQTIIVQQQALEEAHHRLAELERELEERPSGGGFLAGLFGAGDSGARGSLDRPAVHPRRTGHPEAAFAGPRGSFLGGAAQTAVGVAGGVLLGSMIADMLSPAEANAAPAEPEPDGGDAGGDFGSGDDFSF